jgi:flagellar protein FliL
MSNEANEQEKEGQPGGSKKPGMVPMVLAASVGLLGGGVAGALVAGPLLAKQAVARAESVAIEMVAGEGAGEHGEKGKAKGKAKGGEHGEEGAGAAVHNIEGLVLNPAGSGGTRFLLASLALELVDSTTTETLKQRDVEVRDAVLRVLGSKNVVELTDMAARPLLKQQLQMAVDSLFGAETISAVYFPQFVIQ